MINRDTIFKVNNNIEVTDYDNEKVMMDLEKGKYYTLNEVGSTIWDSLSLSKANLVNNIIIKLLEEYDVDEFTCEKAVLDYLRDLEKNELIKVL